MKAGSIIKLISGITAVFVLLGILYGVGSKVDSRYALAAEFQRLEKRLDYKVSDDQRFSTSQEMRQIEERNNGKTIDKWSVVDRNRYKDLQDQLSRIQDKLKSLQ